VNTTKIQKLEHGLSVLKQIKADVPDVILAGGAIRDVYHDKQIKDYDFFISRDNRDADIYDEDFWIETLNLNTTGILCDHIRNVSDDEDGSCSDSNHVEIVWEIEKYSGEIYNIVILDINPEKYVNEYFDIGLCKVYTDGNRLRLTSDFTHDSRYGVLTIVANDMTKQEFFRMMDNHVHRLKQKYRGWKLVVPARFDELYKEWSDLKC